VLYECALLVPMVARVCVRSFVKWSFSNVLSFIIYVDFRRVYIVGADGVVPPYLLFFVCFDSLW
jgi:hypothetical protein